jgi:hypothetical protein
MEHAKVGALFLHAVCVMKPVPINRAKSRQVRTGADSPVGRVDILFHRLAEVAAKKLEARFQMPGIWESFVKPIADEKAQEFEGMGPVEFARHVGFLKTGRKRRRIA